MYPQTVRETGNLPVADRVFEGEIMNADENVKIQRIRTITWEDPRKHAMDAASMSGLQFLRSIRDGTPPPPPVAALLGYRIREIEHGRAVFEIEPAEFHYNPFGSVHGGIAGLLLDTAMTSAVLSTLPKGLIFRRSIII